MKINAKQIESVIALAGSERYKHFVKVVADWEEVWGLYQDGWALASTDDGQTVFPLWPAKEYAQLCSDKEWSGYEPESFSLEDFMGELLPNLKDDGVLPGIFYTPSDKGVTPAVDQLLADLNEELENY
ncbi:DUF2750 domain-containing protein [Marinomonas spartinae]|uniref:DUF2750 domain-containing protein n=1 Tax=Marinomonas spartinae TaxID=1792290 RepID=UPI0018F11464|nr:DUF2750 domain-containing protein [Marinomonas spartinae]MBJ7553940.1 DUF2750 domain-containing protein [Marinomonas spartinae]